MESIFDLDFIELSLQTWESLQFLNFCTIFKVTFRDQFMEDNQVSECAWISELNRPLLSESGIFAKDQQDLSGIIFSKGNLSLRIIYIQLLISLNEFIFILLANIFLYYQLFSAAARKSIKFWHQHRPCKLFLSSRNLETSSWSFWLSSFAGWSFITNCQKLNGTTGF